MQFHNPSIRLAHSGRVKNLEEAACIGYIWLEAEFAESGLTAGLLRRASAEVGRYHRHAGVRREAAITAQLSIVQHVATSFLPAKYINKI